TIAKDPFQHFRRCQTASRIKWPKTIHLISPWVGSQLAARSCFISSTTNRARARGLSVNHRLGKRPVERQTKTVSTMEEPVPLIWIEAPISAGHGIVAEQVRPASRIATARGK